MGDDDALVKLLASIDRRLALLTQSHDREMRTAFRTEMLRTPSRTAMFEGINGQRGSDELANLGGVTKRAAQLFVKELLDLGLVREIGEGRNVIVERDENALVDWYLRRNASDT